eukprot:5331442-Pyramimonas_sp.AAC.1
MSAFMLSQVLMDRSLQLVMHVPVYYGLVAWPLLVRHDEPSTRAVQITQIMDSLNTRFDGGPTKCAEQWEMLESRF